MKLCTVHQRIRAGTPLVRGSVVRTPDGSEIPCAEVTIKAELCAGIWYAELRVPVVFGDPVDTDPGAFDPWPADYTVRPDKEMPL